MFIALILVVCVFMLLVLSGAKTQIEDRQKKYKNLLLSYGLTEDNIELEVVGNFSIGTNSVILTNTDYIWIIDYRNKKYNKANISEVLDVEIFQDSMNVTKDKMMSVLDKKTTITNINQIKLVVHCIKETYTVNFPVGAQQNSDAHINILNNINRIKLLIDHKKSNLNKV